ncbi:MAG: Phage-related baseplate assembly protein [Pelotomaculum sp. PtaB.Bin104]|nr:MAG: Phage-related baseplate assembly protein [Pelotomaculum sp. PtaB.Bin104]
MSLYDLLNIPTGRTGGKVAGVVTGIVSNNQDPDGMGRVKVKFPWRENGDESYWARVATLMAGNDRGSFFLPEVGDEVLVAFEQEDISHPYVIGALWNGQDQPPETNSDGKNNVRKIKSRSGHEILFDDNSDQKKEKLEIHTKAGHKIILDDAAGAEKIQIEDKTGSNKIIIDSAQNSIAMESGMKLSIKAQVIEIEAGGTMTLKSSGTMTIKGAMVQIN